MARDEEEGDGDGLHAGHRGRLRARFLKEGLEGFNDHQVLELILFYAQPRRNTNATAHLLLKRFGSLSAVLEAHAKDLTAVPEVGEAAAVFLSLVPPLTRRYLADREARRVVLFDNPDKVSGYLGPLMTGRTTEVFYLFCLDAQLRLLYPAILSEGTVGETAFHPREAVETILRHKAVSVILAHNHPGGSLKPSVEDKRVTRRLMLACEPIGVRVLDHLIWADGKVFSFQEAGLLGGG